LVAKFKLSMTLKRPQASGPTFVPYNIGQPNFGVPGATDMPVAPGVAPEEPEIPLDTDFIPF
jgi:hypothetical protein